MIKEIELRNWKTHGQTKLVFQKGVNVLIGIMGAGKSSVMEAISFALFGTFPAVKQRRVKLENMIKSRPSREEEAEVKLTFLAGNDEYTVTRKITASGGTTARLDKNGAHFQSQPIRVNEEIAGVLKVDYDTFARAVYSEQNGLDYFLSIAKGDRKKQIDGMLGLDQFAAAEENCTSLINSIKSATGGEESVLSGMDVASLNRQLEKAVSEKDASAKELAALKEREAAAKSELKEMGDAIEEGRKRYRKKEELSKRVAEIEAKVQLLSGEIMKAEEKVRGSDEASLKRRLEESLAEEKKLIKEIDDLELENRKLTKIVAGEEASLKNNERMASEKKALEGQVSGKDSDALARRLGAARGELDATINKIALNRGRLSDIEGSIKELERHLAKCPVCERELGPELSERLISAKRKALETLKVEIAGEEGDEERGRASVKKTEDEIAALSLAVNRMKDYEGVEKAIEAGMARLSAAAEALKKSSVQIERKKRDLEHAREEAQGYRSGADLYKRIAEHKEQVSEYSKLSAESKRDAEAIKITQGEIDALQGSFAEKGASLAKTSATISGIEKQVGSLQENIESLVKQIDGIKEMQQRLERRRALAKNLSLFKSSLIETESFLRGRLTQSINSLMQGVWPELYPYSDYTNLRLSAKSDDYALEAGMQSGPGEEWVQIDAVASGGERSMACLAMRIALSMVVVPNLRWLILDEPTHNIDSTGISKLINVLGDTLPKVVEQVFIITHDDDLKQIASAKVYQLDRDKGQGGPTSVSEL